MGPGTRALSVAATTVVAALFAPAATGGEAASRIIDSTVVCKTTGTGFPDAVRLITISGTPRIPETNASPTAGVTNGEETGGPLIGAGLRTGRAPVGSAVTTGEARISDEAGRRCTRTRVRIPLSSKRLRGGRVGEIGNAYKCTVPAKVIIRIRAVFKRPTSFRLDARFNQAVATGDITVGYLAVATVRGRRPLAFASVHGVSGTARVFAAPSCTESQ
jgi:FlaG/FlaF family flagellin (archaellin)